MDKKAAALAGVIIVLVGGGLLITMSGGSSDDSDSTGTTQVAAGESSTAAGDSTSGDNSGDAGKKKSGSASAPGQYVDYSEDLVKSTPGKKLLFFHAPWCPQCRALEDDIEANGVPDGVTVFKVDYDSNQDLRSEYGVTVQTTMVMVDDDGKKIDDYVAYDEPTFDTVEQALLR